MIVLDKKLNRKAKHNHGENLKIMLSELRDYSDCGGASLEYLALKCGVSTRQIYRYLNELQKMGYEILKTASHNPEYPGGYTLREKEQDSSGELLMLNMLSELDFVKNEILYARYFLQELLVRKCMCQVGIVIPLEIPLFSFTSDDALYASRQTMIISKTSESSWEEIKIRVSAKVLSSVYQVLGGDIISKQKLKDGSSLVQIRTKRGKEMAGLLTSWGKEVDIIEPGHLRFKVLHNCKDILHHNRLRRLDKNDVVSTKSKYLISY
ncbi:helix-turn-helix domain-containing protein [Desulfotomaculum sp. 1211_IL3151]|uniref:helix-turn-helix domain-containing protein n=1 Tax=Desulfotomaculum sp. 1211_IL3151 TaxID=3084055 RepID=UPI002FD8BC2F